MQETSAIHYTIPNRSSLALDQRSFMQRDYGSDSDDTGTISTASHTTLQADGRPRPQSYALSDTSSEPLPVPIPAPRMTSRTPSIAPSVASITRPPSRARSVVPDPRPPSRAQSFVPDPRPPSRTQSVVPDPRPASRAQSAVPDPRPPSRAQSVVPDPRPPSRAQSSAPDPRPASRAASAAHEPRMTSRAPSVIQESRPASRGPSVVHEPVSHSRAPSVVPSDIRPTSAQGGHSPMLRMDYTIPPDNLIPTIVNGVITIPPPFEFNRMPHTPERHPSPRLPDESFGSNLYRPPSPDTASTTLSHIDILREPFQPHLAATPALSAIEELSSQGQASPYYPDTSRDIRKPSAVSLCAC